MCQQNTNKQVAVESTFSSVTPVILLKSRTGRGDASNSVGNMWWSPHRLIGSTA